MTGRTRAFICVCNRDRDAYQVPLALAEAGLLDRFVTDFYAPDGAARALLPAFLRRRRAEGLPRARTRGVWPAFVVQAAARVLRLPETRSFALTDALLARAAARSAARRNAALYCYHSYVPRAVPPGAPLVIFVYHPLADAGRVLLEADARRYPEAAESFAHEVAGGRERAIDWARADAVVCASSFTAASVVAAGCDPAKLAVVPYGIAPAKAPAARRKAGDKIEFLFVGQGVPRKGLHHLIRAWQRDPPANARLTIVSYRIDAAIAALIASDTIELVRYLPRAELSARFARADVFVMPSLIEGFGLVYGEALAHGCHVIGTANSGLPDLALGEDAVTLVTPGDVDELAAALARCARRARAQGFDRGAIAAAAARRSWEEFRARIAAHARAVLAGERC